MGILATLLLHGCDAGAGGDGSWFRFTLDGQDFEVGRVELSVTPLDGGRSLVLMSSPWDGGPSVSLVVRMALDPSRLQGVEIGDRHLGSDPSGAFALTTRGEAGASFGPGSTLTLRFDEVADGFVRGSFQATRLDYSESFADFDSTPVNASGSFRLPVDGARGDG